MSKQSFCAIFIFFAGFMTEFALNLIANRTQNLLREVPDQCPYCGYYLDGDEEDDADE